jgi:translocation and assembly module TamA
VDADNMADLHPGFVRRYDAFHIGEEYDVWNVAITERRVVEDNLVIGTHFTNTCTDNGVSLHQAIQPGLPRLFQVGVGFDSEKGPVFKLQSHYSRLNKRGSSLDASLNTSFRIQEFGFLFNWYILREPSRFFLKPKLNLKRDIEINNTIFTNQLSMLPTLSWDDKDLKWEVSLGPSFEIDETLAGVGPPYAQALFFNQTLLVASHGFEFYKDNPQRGFRVGTSSSLSNQSLASSITASLFSISAEALFNWGDFSPPSMILGIRGGYATTVTANGTEDLKSLPIPFRYYLGGTQDIRGFLRQELPDNSGLGAMTKIFAGFETRFLALLPAGFQPFLFTDGGMLGSQPDTLDSPLFWSPGLGIRWASSIGAFRLEAAHGFVSDRGISIRPELSHWQFYISYGEEF